MKQIHVIKALVVMAGLFSTSSAFALSCDGQYKTMTAAMGNSSASASVSSGNDVRTGEPWVYVSYNVGGSRYTYHYTSIGGIYNCIATFSQYEAKTISDPKAKNLTISKAQIQSQLGGLPLVLKPLAPAPVKKLVLPALK